MKKTILLVTLTTISISSIAEWTSVPTDDLTAIDRAIYIDLDTAVKSGNIIKLWVLNDFKKSIPRIPGPGIYKSSTALQEFDCMEYRTKLHRTIQFSDNMGRGTVVHRNSDESSWISAEPGTPSLLLWKAACGKSKANSSDPRAGKTSRSDVTTDRKDGQHKPEWFELEPGFYADSESVRYISGNVRITFVYDLTREKLVQGEPYLSVTSRREIDCSLKRQRALSVEFYSENMARGKVVASDPKGSAWGSVAAGEDDPFWKFACGKTNLK